MKRNLSIIMISLASITIGKAQLADTAWTKSIGGSATEVAGTALLNNAGAAAASVAIDIDGNYYVASNTSSSNGFVYGNKGSDDIWVIKLNPMGDTLWTKVIGGSDFERVYKIRAISTGGVVLVGQTLSNNGDFAGNHGINDGFVLKLDANGTIVWKKLYGGSGVDYLFDIAENPAGNFVVCGETGSNDGDLTGTGSGLCWVLYISGTSGTISMSKAFSSTNSSSANYLDNFTCIKRLSDGSGYIVSGFTTIDFNNPASDDIFVAKVNFNGVLLWRKNIGSATGGDGSAAILDAGNGEFYIAGKLGGTGGNAPAYRGGNGDAWLIKCNSNGDILWTKNYGGNNWDFFTDAVIDANYNLYLSGFTRSTDFDLATTTANGLADFWITKIDSSGTILQQKRLGGTSNDFALGIALNQTNNEVIAVGRTESNDGFVHHNNGGRDLWVVKLSETTTTSISDITRLTQLLVYPNPANNILTVQLENNLDKVVNLSIVDVLGNLVYSISTIAVNNTININTSLLSNGIYLLNVKGISINVSQKIIIQHHN
jgi:hypothetical protein